MPGTQCPPGAGAVVLGSLPRQAGGGPGRACAAQSRIPAVVQILAPPLLPFEPSEPLFFQLWNGNLNGTWSLKSFGRMREGSAQSLAHSNHSHKYPPSLVQSEILLESKRLNRVFSNDMCFARKKIWVPVSAVPTAGCVIFHEFLDLSELHCPHLQNKDDSAHLTR